MIELIKKKPWPTAEWVDIFKISMLKKKKKKRIAAFIKRCDLEHGAEIWKKKKIKLIKRKIQLCGMDILFKRMENTLYVIVYNDYTVWYIFATTRLV